MTVEELKEKYVGMEGESMQMEVDNSNIKMYAQAVGDLNPLFIDDEYAAKSRYGGLIAPPGFWGWPSKVGALPALMMEFIGGIMGAGYPILLDGGVEMEFERPIRPGDKLTGTPKIEDVSSRTNKSGKTMVFGTIGTTYVNQKGELVGKVHNMLMCLSL
ncbi:MAG: MaoC family dehydratase N-terminal domain-containing protein [Chloroflexota bacterium]|nr:MaoC family dehydratase N-terminal domain-containing protein [Chloroflexota bacterium]